MKTVKVYSTTYCSFCDRAKELLRGKQIPFEEVDVTGDDEARAKLVEMTNGLRTVPQIFIGETHVGGYTDLAKADRDGSLDRMLA